MIFTDAVAKKWLKKTLFIINLVIGILLCLLYFNIFEFILIFFLEGIIAVIVTRFYIEIGESFLKEIEKIEIDDGTQEEGKHEGLEKSKINNVIDRFKNHYERFHITAFILIGILCFLLIALTYGYKFYGRISPTFGGGKLEQIVYVCEKDTIGGQKIYETENYVFVFLKDSTIKKIDWKDISKILKQPKD